MVSPNQEAVMTEFRQYAKEAMDWASKVISENENQNLIDLVCTWSQAALISERALEPSFVFVSTRRREATSLTRS
jgi:hypothetical protein